MVKFEIPTTSLKMRTYVQPKPLGTDPATTQFERDVSRSEELNFFDSTTVTWEQTTRGVRAHARLSGPGAGPSDFFFPFKIYNMGNASATDVQKAVYTAAGQSIDTFTFQVRGGVVEYRSSKTPTQETPFAILALDVDCPNTDTGTNFGDPPVSNTAASISLANNADTLIFDTSAPYPADQPVQVLVDPGFDGFTQSLASFWVKIIDSGGSGVYAQLWGRMFTADGLHPYGRPNLPFPSNLDTSIIPIGYVTIYQGLPADNFVYQYQWGNLVNRFTALAPLVSPLGPVAIQRGAWVADALSGQVFWTGDIVIDDSVVLAALAPLAQNLYGVYTCIGGAFGSVVAPSSDLARWRLTGVFYGP